MRTIIDVHYNPHTDAIIILSNLTRVSGVTFCVCCVRGDRIVSPRRLPLPGGSGSNIRIPDCARCDGHRQCRSEEDRSIATFDVAIGVPALSDLIDKLEAGFKYAGTLEDCLLLALEALGGLSQGN